MNNINILVEAKKEYTNQLLQILKPRIYEGFKSMYDDTVSILGKEYIEYNTQSSSVIKSFQKALRDIPLWNQEMINREYDRILNSSKCDYFEDLIETVFITNIKNTPNRLCLLYILRSIQSLGEPTLYLSIAARSLHCS